MLPDSMLSALQASGPHPEHAKQLMLFGQFVGAWEVDITNIAPDGTKREIKGNGFSTGSWKAGPSWTCGLRRAARCAILRSPTNMARPCASLTRTFKHGVLPGLVQ